MKLQDVAYDGEADPGALFPLGRVVTRLIETIEDPVQVLLRDPHPRVAHLDEDESRLPSRGHDLERPPLP